MMGWLTGYKNIVHLMFRSTSAIGAILATVWTSISVESARGQTAMRQLVLPSEVQVASQIVCFTDLIQDGFLKRECERKPSACCPLDLQGARGRTWTLSEIKSYLARLNSAQLSFEVQIQGGGSLHVEQTHALIPEGELKQEILKALHGAELEPSAEYEIESVESGHILKAPVDAPWKVELPASSAYWVREIPARVLSKTAYGWALVGVVRVQISARDTIYVAKRPLSSRDAVKSEDFETKKVDLFSLSGIQKANVVRASGPFPAKSRLKQSLRPGQVLTNTALEKVPLVSTGEFVQVIFKTDTLRIKARGVAQGNGGEGDTVSVQMNSSQKVFRGKITEEKTVEVWL